MSVLARREPALLAATLLGALFLWQGWETPPFLTHALDLLGQLAIPLMLITLGVMWGIFLPAAWLVLVRGGGGVTAMPAASIESSAAGSGSSPEME